jgi:hypothetical protein
LASSKATFVASTIPSLEIPNYSWISTESIKKNWPRTLPWILPSFVASKVRKKSRNRSSHGIVHYKLNMPSKPARLAHLSSLESLFIHYNIFWLSFTLNIVFFIIGFLTCSSTCALPIRFIIALVLNLRHWGITL